MLLEIAWCATCSACAEGCRPLLCITNESLVQQNTRKRKWGQTDKRLYWINSNSTCCRRCISGVDDKCSSTPVTQQDIVQVCFLKMHGFQGVLHAYKSTFYIRQERPPSSANTRCLTWKQRSYFQKDEKSLKVKRVPTTRSYPANTHTHKVCCFSKQKRKSENLFWKQ